MPGDELGRLPRLAVKRTHSDGKRLGLLVIPVADQAGACDQAHQADQEDGANPEWQRFVKSIHENRT
jgi:hypothetical protein